jgi:hypothetical protein
MQPSMRLADEPNPGAICAQLFFAATQKEYNGYEKRMAMDDTRIMLFGATGMLDSGGPGDNTGLYGYRGFPAQPGKL